MKTAFMIVDMQKDFVEEGNPLTVRGAKEVVPKIKEALQAAREAQIPIIHVVRQHRADGTDVEKFRYEIFKKTPYAVEHTEGAEIIEDLKEKDDEIILPKKRFSAFFQTNLDSLLKRMGVEKLVISGIQTPNCIRATATDALALDYDVILLEDAIGAKNADIHNSNLEDMKSMGIEISAVEDFAGSLK
jgi:nicotinamidase-related amidase